MTFVLLGNYTVHLFKVKAGWKQINYYWVKICFRFFVIRNIYKIFFFLKIWLWKIGSIFPRAKRSEPLELKVKFEKVLLCFSNFHQEFLFEPFFSTCQSYKTQNIVKLQKKLLSCNKLDCFLKEKYTYSVINSQA